MLSIDKVAQLREIRISIHSKSLHVLTVVRITHLVNAQHMARNVVNVVVEITLNLSAKVENSEALDQSQINASNLLVSLERTPRMGVIPV